MPGLPLTPAIAVLPLTSLPAALPPEGTMSEPTPADQPPADRSGGTARPPAGKSGAARFVLILAACAGFAYGLDQLTKAWVVGTMSEGDIIPVLPPLLHWHFIRNSGAAFSIGEDYTWVFTIIMSVVAAAIIFYAGRIRSLWWSVALGFLLGGVLGNLTDRLFREPGFGVGHVVDFIALPNFAIFNIADSAIVGSVILWCLLTLRGIGMDGRRVTDGKDEDGVDRTRRDRPQEPSQGQDSA
ncbi:lipoprotein signal peptidase [Arthrobacter mangrovi]|uniref:Lipoprotein signal peptidase n=2 Tax=Arthrobacter mangrovi TaxID=2966350 RepID=A0ABQ5MQD2_9MICC|nr:lipoprotein signal peptidase [Arthrobacter mangrovi]